MYLPECLASLSLVAASAEGREAIVAYSRIRARRLSYYIPSRYIQGCYYPALSYSYNIMILGVGGSDLVVVVSGISIGTLHGKHDT